jgi:hypothetical protein
MAHDDVSERELYLLEVDQLAEIPKTVFLSSKYFVCLTVADNTMFQDVEIRNLARTLLESGCAYLCSWGKDSDRVHTLADLEAIELEATLLNAELLMTTSHEDEPLSEALWFAFNSAWPDDECLDECRSILVMVIGNHDWGLECKEALSDLSGFNRRLLDRDSDTTITQHSLQPTRNPRG